MWLRSCLALLIYLSAMHAAGAEGIRLRYAQAYSALRTVFALPLFIANVLIVFVSLLGAVRRSRVTAAASSLSICTSGSLDWP